MVLLNLSPERAFESCWPTSVIFAGYIPVLPEAVLLGGMPESMSDKACICFTNTLSYLSFPLEFGPAKMSSCIQDAKGGSNGNRTWTGILWSAKSKRWGDLGAAFFLLSQSVSCS